MPGTINTKKSPSDFLMFVPFLSLNDPESLFVYTLSGANSHQFYLRGILNPIDDPKRIHSKTSYP